MAIDPKTMLAFVRALEAHKQNLPYVTLQEDSAAELVARTRPLYACDVDFGRLVAAQLARCTRYEALLADETSEEIAVHVRRALQVAQIAAARAIVEAVEPPPKKGDDAPRAGIVTEEAAPL